MRTLRSCCYESTQTGFLRKGGEISQRHENMQLGRACQTGCLRDNLGDRHPLAKELARKQRTKGLIIAHRVKTRERYLAVTQKVGKTGFLSKISRMLESNGFRNRVCLQGRTVGVQSCSTLESISVIARKLRKTELKIGHRVKTWSGKPGCVVTS